MKRLSVILVSLLITLAPSLASAQAVPISVFITSVGEVADAANGFKSAPDQRTMRALQEIRKNFSKWGKKEGIVVVQDATTAKVVIEYIGDTERALTPPTTGGLARMLAPTTEYASSGTLVIGDYRKPFSVTDEWDSAHRLAYVMFDFIKANRAQLIK